MEAKKMKTIFWNVDTQYDFMRSDDSFKGRLAVPDAREIESNLEIITKTAENYRKTVINTADWHDVHTEEISDTPDYINKFPEHCMKNTTGANYVPATKPVNPVIVDWDKKYFDRDAVKNNRNIVIRKDKFDAFTGNPHSKDIVNKIKPDKVIVYGVATNYCVKYAVQGLIDYRKNDGRKLEVMVVEDAIKEIPNEPKEQTINYWKDNGVKMIQTKELENYLK
jgi:nicotinamidase/pyrazinamidase